MNPERSSTRPDARPAGHEVWMRHALRLAQKARRVGEVPVGALVVREGQVIGRGWNQVESKQDATQHAELIALRQASRRLKTWRLTGCDLYVTLEPCAMCAGALVWSRIARIIYAAADPKAGACGTLLSVAGHPGLNHRPELLSGILAQESAQLLQTFFQQLRQTKRIKKTKP